MAPPETKPFMAALSWGKASLGLFMRLLKGRDETVVRCGRHTTGGNAQREGPSIEKVQYTGGIGGWSLLMPLGDPVPAGWVVTQAGKAEDFGFCYSWNRIVKDIRCRISSGSRLRQLGEEKLDK